MSQNYENYENSLYEVDMDCVREQQEVERGSLNMYGGEEVQQMGCHERNGCERNGCERNEAIRERRFDFEETRIERESQRGCGSQIVVKEKGCHEREYHEKECHRERIENHRKNSCGCNCNWILLLFLLCCWK